MQTVNGQKVVSKAISGVPLPIIDPKAAYAGMPVGERSGGMVVASGGAVRYAITNLSTPLPASSLDSAKTRRLRLRASVERWVVDGIDVIQLREKALDTGEVFELAAEAVELLRRHLGPYRPRLLVNGRPDIAAAAGADGVHLTSRAGELTPAQARTVFRQAGLPQCLVSISCHTAEEVAMARDRHADLILFGPVFGKIVAGRTVAEGVGLEALAAACRLAHPVPVLALGGIAAATVPLCLTHGAAGVAAIRLFAGTADPHEKMEG